MGGKSNGYQVPEIEPWETKVLSDGVRILKVLQKYLISHYVTLCQRHFNVKDEYNHFTTVKVLVLPLGEDIEGQLCSVF